MFAISQVGTIYTTGSKIAEHGGDNPGDRDVPLVVYAPGDVHRHRFGQRVEATQVAPTILKLLGLVRTSLRPSSERARRSCPAWASASAINRSV